MDSGSESATTPKSNAIANSVNSNNTNSVPAQSFTNQTPKSQTLKSDPAEHSQFITKKRLQNLVKEVDPSEQLDEEVEEMLLQLADDFVETTISAACLLAKHRHANTVEVKDVQLHLEKNWNMWIPGFGTDEIRPYKRSTVTESHKQRLALIRKCVKKY
ncbi:transcription initiation factor TFIID subunit 12 [Trichogramma pretiosum]|uniref:transcription initiation factor TFIID subunit 12 n=1 Tax=Trichogramma pretiosum TaxID=7493 RepID=UPI0006C9467C|nr:transcription initiation factor TFIID subunit 12 [Trichogramma pretiosum]